ncbi:MAG: LicD family protein [Bacteroidota bacterium]
MKTEEKYFLIDGERFYFKEKEFVQGSGKKINLEISKENLEILHSVLEQTTIKYGLIFGTLLGAIREQNFIAHDEDADIYVLNEDRDKFLRLLYELKNHDFEVKRYKDDLISIMRKNEYIDIYFFKPKKKFGIFKLRVMGNVFECPANYLEHPDRIMFLGMNMPVPNHAEKLLVEMYGKDWRVPKPGFFASENTIYYKISALTKKWRKLPFSESIQKPVKALLEKLGV